ncbi:hypothetical protein PTSG_11701 [Salpingoeca rosetta]|uniref:ubiquitinyl hydrolase 1 n=1 Tax=Salpingoeca rosetta (strain ATCC 50818 / BSB-021) TaxID=946362 RepID=F2TZU7_SALR5|nr:uncharacterized protein PTSG_11701 [Salpingoeca rosetta]EGD80675.1 hypothetical protein PTSG_11701 [Salpingoeca rosetta]|eukprot:XP_004997236.1 hypothetical protein PTSG_11701 [Salpingoeca rosetta]
MSDMDVDPPQPKHGQEEGGQEQQQQQDQQQEQSQQQQQPEAPATTLPMDRINELKTQLRLGVRMAIDEQSQLMGLLNSLLQAQERGECDDSCETFLKDVLLPCILTCLNSEQLLKWSPDYLVDIRQLLINSLDALIPRMDSDDTQYIRVTAQMMNYRTLYHQQVWCEKSMSAPLNGPDEVYALFSVDTETDSQYGFLIDICDAFGVKGGFKRALQIVTNPESSLVQVVLAASCTFFSGHLPSDMCREQFVYPMFDKMYDRVLNATLKELRPLVPELVKDNGILSAIRNAKLVLAARQDIEVNRVLDNLHLAVIDKMLRVQSFNATMYALDELKGLIHRINAQSKPDARFQFTAVTAGELTDWMAEKKLLELLFSDNLHKTSYVNRVQEIVRFTATTRLTLQDLELIWKAQEGKHGVIVDNIHDLLAHLAYHFGPEQLDHLFSLVQASWGGSDQNMMRLLRLIQRLAEEDAAGEMAHKVMEVVWSLAHNPDTSHEIADEAVASMVKILQGRFFHDASGADVNKWLDACLRELKEQRWVVPAMRMMEALLDLFSRHSDSKHASPRDVVLNRLLRQGLQDAVLDLCEAYQEKAKQRLEALGGDEKALDNTVVFEMSTHRATMQQLHKLLHFIVAERESYMALDDAVRLWLMLVEGAPTAKDRTAGLRWFSRVLVPDPDLDADAQRFLLENHLLHMDLETMPITAIKCVLGIFFNINTEEHVLERNSSGHVHVYDPSNIWQLDCLWELACSHAEETVAALVIRNLIQIFTGLTNQDPLGIVNSCLDKVNRTLIEDTNGRPDLVERKAVRGLDILRRFLTHFDVMHDFPRVHPPIIMAHLGLPCKVHAVSQEGWSLSVELTSTSSVALLRMRVCRFAKMSGDRLQLSFQDRVLSARDDHSTLAMVGLYHGAIIEVETVADSKCLDMCPQPNARKEEKLPSRALSHSKQHHDMLRRFLLEDVPPAVQDAAMRVLLHLPGDLDLQRTVFATVVDQQQSISPLFEDATLPLLQYRLFVLCSVLRPSRPDTFPKAAIQSFKALFWSCFGVDDVLRLLQALTSPLGEETNPFRYSTAMRALQALLVVVHELVDRSLAIAKEAGDDQANTAGSTTSAGKNKNKASGVDDTCTPPLSPAKAAKASEAAGPSTPQRVPSEQSKAQAQAVAQSADVESPLKKHAGEGKRSSDSATATTTATASSTSTDAAGTAATAVVSAPSGASSSSGSTSSGVAKGQRHAQQQSGASSPTSSRSPPTPASASSRSPSSESSPLDQALSAQQQQALLDALLTVFRAVCDPTEFGARINKDTAADNLPVAMDLVYLFKRISNLSSPICASLVAAWSTPDMLRLLTLRCPYAHVRSVCVRLLCDAVKDLPAAQGPLWHTASMLLDDCQDLQGTCECDHFFQLFSCLVLLPDVDIPEAELLSLASKQVTWLEAFCADPSDAAARQDVLAGRLKLIDAILSRLSTVPPQLHEGFVCGMLNHLLFRCGRYLADLRALPELPSDLAVPEFACDSEKPREEAFNVLISLVSRDVTLFNLIASDLKELHYVPEYMLKTEFGFQPVIKPRTPGAFVGLKNAAATCYMNSVLQQLFMQPDTQQLLLGQLNIPAEKQEDSVLHHVTRMFAHLKYSARQYYTPKGLWRTYKHWGAPVDVREQQDACEFFNCLIDQVDEGLKSLKKPAALCQVFGGMFVDQKIIKSGCSHRYERDEPFTTIPIAIRNCKTLTQALDNYVQGELLEGANAYKCEKCDAKRDTIKRTCIKTLPRVLVLQLKRFDYDWERGVPVKFNDYFEFPDELDMGPYTAAGRAAVEDDAGEVPKEMYRLAGVVVHSGQANGGHYTSYVCQRDHAGNMSDRWLLFEDHEVTDVEFSGVQSMATQWFGGETTSQVYDKQLGRTVPRVRDRWWNAYMLFYERVNVGPLELALPKPSPAAKEEGAAARAKGSGDAMEEGKQGEEEGNEEEEEQPFTQIDCTPSVSQRLNVMHDNIVWGHQREMFNTEYFDFIFRLAGVVGDCIEVSIPAKGIAAQRKSKTDVVALDDAAQLDALAVQATDLSLDFLLGDALLTDDEIRDSLDDWPVTLRPLLRHSTTCREMARQRLQSETEFIKFLILNPDDDARAAFSQFVFEVVYASILEDGPDVGLPLATHTCKIVHTALKTIGVLQFSQIGESFQLLLEYVKLGSQYRQLMIDLDMMPILLTFLQHMGELGLQNPLCFNLLVSLVSVLIRSMGMSSLRTCEPPQGVSPPTLLLHDKEIGGTSQPLPLLESVCALLPDSSFWRALLERHAGNMYAMNMVCDACFCSQHVSYVVILTLNVLVDELHHYEFHPYLNLLQRVFQIDDGMRLYRFRLSCEGNNEQFVSLFRVINFCKMQFHKKSYFVAKVLTWALLNFPELREYLVSDRVRKHWIWVINWLGMQLHTAIMPVEHESNVDSRSYAIERTDSAVNLHRALLASCGTLTAKAPSTDNAEEDDDDGDDDDDDDDNDDASDENDDAQAAKKAAGGKARARLRDDDENDDGVDGGSNANNMMDDSEEGSAPSKQASSTPSSDKANDTHQDTEQPQHQDTQSSA